MYFIHGFFINLLEISGVYAIAISIIELKAIFKPRLTPSKTIRFFSAKHISFIFHWRIQWMGSRFLHVWENTSLLSVYLILMASNGLEVKKDLLKIIYISVYHLYELKHFKIIVICIHYKMLWHFSSNLSPLIINMKNSTDRRHADKIYNLNKKKIENSDKLCIYYIT